MSSENTGQTPEEHARAAMVAYAVKEYFAGLCDPYIEANAAFIEGTPGLRSTSATIDGLLAVTFTESRRKPSFFVENEDEFVEYADQKGEARFVANEAFEKGVLRRARWDAENGVAYDKDSGEILPGIGYKPGGDFISVKPSWTDGGREYVSSILAEVLGGAVKALPMLSPDEQEPETASGPERER
ncbi:hypothetical protein [Streptomyces sp. NPDC088915]|uniref:hypothetical protein n=1 Tax=Streptomyces sp. NPDC088915 TaxID=3365912 RepID=UPI0038293EE9